MEGIEWLNSTTITPTNEILAFLDLNGEEKSSDKKEKKLQYRKE